MSYIHRCIIIPAHRQALMQAVCVAAGGAEYAEMFIVGLSPGGLTPATYYISAGPIESEFAAMLTDASLLSQACIAADLSITLDECQALLTDADVSTDEPAEIALNRLGLALTKYD